MPHIEINRNEFEELLGEEVSDEELREKADFLGVHWTHVEGKKWDVEVYPDRPDLLSVEGLARAYRGFFGIDTGLENYQVSKGDAEVKIHDSVEEVRPYIGGAVVRNLELSKRMINGLIQLQEKLHVSFGRQREKLAIGLHDLDEIEPPFTYKAVEPEKVSFKPLEYDRDMELGEILDEHEKGREYAWILEDEDRYPVIVDSDDQVLSFPPIINNQLTEVTTGTRDVFIDVTGNHRETVEKALNILVTALAERGGEIEAVSIDGREMPDLEPEKWELDQDYMEKVSGLQISGEELVERLEKMKFGAEKGSKIKVEVPAYRTDVMHGYDLIEDAVIAHGYDNIEPELPEVDQIAKQDPVQKFTNDIRDVLLRTGALETNTHVLSSNEKLFGKMEIEEEEIVEMSNALTEDYSVVRNWLLPSLMEVLQENKHNRYPQKFFEAEDVSVLDDSDTGASNQRKLAYVVSGNDVGFTDARQAIQVLERDLGVEFGIESSDKECFRQNRSGNVYLDGEKVGIVGEFSEDVVDNWELERKVAGFELDVEKMLEIVRE